MKRKLNCPDNDAKKTKLVVPATAKTTSLFSVEEKASKAGVSKTKSPSSTLVQPGAQSKAERITENLQNPLYKIKLIITYSKNYWMWPGILL